MSSNLHRLYLVSLFFYLVHSTAPKSGKKRNKLSPVIMDTSSIVEAVQPGVSDALISDPPQNQLIPKRVSPFKKLIDEKNYGEITRLAASMKDSDLLDQLCQVMTAVEHYIALSDLLISRHMASKFLERGNLTLVKEIPISCPYGFSTCLSDGILGATIISSLEKGLYDRVFTLLDSIKKCYAGCDEQRRRDHDLTEFEAFVFKFLQGQISQEKFRILLKRLLTLDVENINKDYTQVFEAFCQAAVIHLKGCHRNSTLTKFFTDMVGHPSILTETMFVDGFLNPCTDATELAHFIRLSWKEAIVEGLKDDIEWRSKLLWEGLVKEFPTMLTEEHPPSEETRSLVLEKFSTKQQIEARWIKENSTKLYESLTTILPQMPLVLLELIAKYALSWDTL